VDGHKRYDALCPAVHPVDPTAECLWQPTAEALPADLDGLLVFENSATHLGECSVTGNCELSPKPRIE